MPMTLRFLLSCILFSLAHGLFAQPREKEISLDPEAAREDLRIATDLLLAVHPDPFRYHSEAELRSLVQNVADSLGRPLKVAHFRELLMPIFHAIGDAGCQLVQPQVPYDAPLLPLEVVVQGNRVLVSNDLKGFRSLPSGSAIVSINDRPIEEIVEAISDHVVSDGTNQTFRNERIGATWSGSLYHYVDASDRFQLRYIDPDGAPGSALIMGMTQMEVSVSQRPSGISLAPWHSTLHPDQDALWLTLETLDPKILEAAKVDPVRYLKALRKEMQRNDIRHLVIDVRNATGTELAMAELVFSFIAKEELRVVQSMSIRSATPPADRMYTSVHEDFYSTVPQLFVPDGSGSYTVLPSDPRLAMVPPMKKTYTGKVNVVCNGGTREAGAAFVMLAKRSQRARIVGEEVGSNAFSFNGGRSMDVTLPRSGLRFAIPLVRYVPDGKVSGPLDRGEMPHHTLSPAATDLAKGRDTVKSALLKLFNEL